MINASKEKEYTTATRSRPMPYCGRDVQK